MHMLKSYKIASCSKITRCQIWFKVGINHVIWFSRSKGVLTNVVFTTLYVIHINDTNVTWTRWLILIYEVNTIPIEPSKITCSETERTKCSKRKIKEQYLISNAVKLDPTRIFFSIAKFEMVNIKFIICPFIGLIITN